MSKYLMLASTTFVLILISNLVDASVINEKFREEEIFPDILDEVTDELSPLNISYLISGVNVSLGNELTPSQVRQQPNVAWDAEVGAFYTLLMTDPDAPSRENPIRREIRHWLAMNINGNDLNSGDVIFEYRGSGPSYGTGLHRYIFLLFKQMSNNLEYETNSETLERANTNTRNLMSEFNLTLVAGDYFQAQFEGAAGFINEKFREAEIVPDIINDFTVELQALNVTYTSSEVIVELGNALKPSQVRDAPEVRWAAEAGAFYTLLMTDPDAPSRETPTLREIRHWLTMNINGSDLNSGDTIFEYVGSMPPEETGLHRYIFLLFKQNSNNLEYVMNNATLERTNTNTRNLISEFNLTLVGGDFYQAEYESAAGLKSINFCMLLTFVLAQLYVVINKMN